MRRSFSEHGRAGVFLRPVKEQTFLTHSRKGTAADLRRQSPGMSDVRVSAYVHSGIKALGPRPLSCRRLCDSLRRNTVLHYAFVLFPLWRGGTSAAECRTLRGARFRSHLPVLRRQEAHAEATFSITLTPLRRPCNGWILWKGTFEDASIRSSASISISVTLCPHPGRPLFRYLSAGARDDFF